jgi:hypothetical protein
MKLTLTRLKKYSRPIQTIPARKWKKRSRISSVAVASGIVDLQKPRKVTEQSSSAGAGTLDEARIPVKKPEQTEAGARAGGGRG